MSGELLVRSAASASDLRAVREIRTEVFIVEQSCPPEEEWDGRDETSRHLLGWLGKTAVAVARWRTVVHEERLVAKLERFAVRPEYRGRGFGRQMVAAAIDDARAAGFDTYLIHAQAHLEDYYSALQFQPFGEAFMEAGIRHVAMIRFG